MSTAARIIVGASIFALLASVDLYRNRARATRWREYLFLILCVLAAIIYGIVNDQITSRISWEYFYYAKELDAVLGPTIPPDERALHAQALLVGIKATWWVGLLIGAVMLIANNPRRGRARLSYWKLTQLLGVIFALAALCSALLGWAGYHGWLSNLSSGFHEWWEFDLIRPRQFFCVWGIHLGGYFGGLIGSSLIGIFTTTGPQIAGVNFLSFVGFVLSGALGLWLLWGVLRSGRL